MESYQRLECEIAEWVGRMPSQVVACSSGTAALHLAIECLRLSKSSEVVTSEFNMIACPRSISLSGAYPSLVDCNRDLLMDREQVSWSLTRQAIKAVLAVHIYGRLCDMDHLFSAINVKNRCVSVIEDMAEAHGCNIHPYSYAACYSFYRNKIVHGEEGGCVVFKDPSCADYARRLRCLGFNENHDFWHAPRGHNYRLSNCHAELIRQSLKDFHKNLARRNELVEEYDNVFPKEWKMPPRGSPWVYDLRIFGLTGDRQKAIVNALNDAGVKARYSFKPVSLQPEFHVCFSRGREESLRASREVFYLPLDPETVNTCTVRKSYDIVSRYVS